MIGLAFALAYSLTVSTGQNHGDVDRQKAFGVALSACQKAHAEGRPGKCALYGRIQYVTSFPDVKVKVVDAFPDIRVKVVSAFADGPGKWKIVSSFPDFRVQKVTAFPDYRIKFVKAFPGCD